MTERYEKWRDLKPLEAPVPVGTKCVVIGGGGIFKSGCIVFVVHCDAFPQCFGYDGKTACIKIEHLALLPAEPTASTEYSEWRKREVWDCAKRVYAQLETMKEDQAIHYAESLMTEWERRYNK